MEPEETRRLGAERFNKRVDLTATPLRVLTACLKILMRYISILARPSVAASHSRRWKKEVSRQDAKTQRKKRDNFDWVGRRSQF